MNMDPKAQRIVDWRESFSTLPDDYFFEIVRMYLGEVKTPYNKQKLIEELSAFLRKEENKKNLVKLLSDDDLKIITAVRIMPGSTQEKLSQFFTDIFSVAIFYERLENLQERLLLYSHKNKLDGKEVIDINPLLEDVLSPFEKGEFLLPKTDVIQPETEQGFVLTPQFIASFISFVSAHGDLCKADGSFKKKASSDLMEIYGDNLEQLQALTKAFCNLNVFHYDDKEITVDWDRLKNFALLTPVSQYVYIAISSTIHLSRNPLQVNAQLLVDVLRAIDPSGYTKENILRLALIMKEKSGGEEQFNGGRFARIMSMASGQDFGDGGIILNTISGSLMDGFIDACIDFGFLQSVGMDENGSKVYVPADFMIKNQIMLEVPKVLSIDSGFFVTLLPGLSLKQMIHLMRFMDAVRFDTAATFEITKRSVMRGFDSAYTTDEIFGLLEEFSMFPVPQNLKISIEEWHSSYCSASLYKGYVLKVSQENYIKTQKNPVLEKYIKEVLAPGILLLNFKNDDEAKAIIKKSGLDFIGDIKTAKETPAVMPFGELRKAGSRSFELLDEFAPPADFTRGVNEQKDLFAELKKELAAMDCTKEQREGLMDRISRKIIVSPVQLRPSSVRFERVEALGIDYTGKIHVIESAIQSNSMLEIESEDSQELLIGTPLSLNKKSGNAELIIDLEPDHNHKVISVSGAVRIKKIRTRHITF